MFKIVNFALKIFYCLGILFIINSCGYINKSANNFQQQYVKGSQDIPLADGLSLIDEEEIEFDTLLGSFDSTSYIANISPAIIMQFYLDNLPKLGWNLQKNSSNQLIFNRENQKLTIKFYSENQDNIVNFSITTAQK
jgi:hypothetical protein